VNRDTVLIHRDSPIPLTIFHVPNRAPHPTCGIFGSQPAIFVAYKDIRLALVVTSIKFFFLKLELALPARMESLLLLNIFLSRFIQATLKIPRISLCLCLHLRQLFFALLLPNQILFMLLAIGFSLKNITIYLPALYDTSWLAGFYPKRYFALSQSNPASS
jgi:hypothetical protein